MTVPEVLPTFTTPRPMRSILTPEEQERHRNRCPGQCGGIRPGAFLCCQRCWERLPEHLRTALRTSNMAASLVKAALRWWDENPLDPAAELVLAAYELALRDVAAGINRTDDEIVNEVREPSVVTP